MAHKFALLCLVLCAQLTFASAAHAQRVALLIGNSSYQSAPLTNPPNDVRVMETALKRVGFKVQKVLNANQNQLKRAVRDFGEAAYGAEVALLYYSGHGTQTGGENYLLPDGAVINKESDYEVEAVAANALLRQIVGARPKAAIVVLDACRDNPYASATKSTTKGLARMEAPTGTMIAFATSPGTTAGDEGYYAKALAEQLTIPGQELIQVFRNTGNQVRKLSNGKQEPRISEVSINDEVYLAGQRQVATIRPDPGAQQGSLIVPTQSALLTISAGQTVKDCVDCPEMVVIPAGSFEMGGNGSYADEQPAHWVNIKSFVLGKTEVTQGQWKAVMDSHPSIFSSCGDDCPVENVSWNDAQRLCAQAQPAYREKLPLAQRS
ncbi:MAG: caspase family protein [Comamonadaceae bacterium]|nr:caspase family protein [Comamonadaceae bacterium]